LPACHFLYAAILQEGKMCSEGSIDSLWRYNTSNRSFNAEKKDAAAQSWIIFLKGDNFWKNTDHVNSGFARKARLKMVVVLSHTWQPNSCLRPYWISDPRACD
jgi:hypothetical protein